MEQVMKNLLALLVICSLVMVPLASALSIPVPVSGTLTTEGYRGGYEVTVTNTRTGETTTILTNPSRQYFISSWNNEFANPNYQDIFRIEVEGVVKNVVYTGGPIEADFTLDLTCPKQYPCECSDCDCGTCPSCNSCCESGDCPDCNCECPADTTPYAECNSCCQPEDCEDCPVCPEPDANRAVEILMGVLGGVAVGGSAVTLTLGKKAKHYHRGIKNKHSIFTRHRDARIRHPIGEVAPLYRLVDGKYAYIHEGAK
jgi:hypothetical protein